MADKKQKREILTSPKGIAVYPHLNKPDEYKGKKRYKVMLRVSEEDFAGLKRRIDEAVDNAWDALISQVKPAARKQFSKHYPYEEEYDDNEEPTGNYLVKFTKNAEFEDKKGNIVETTLPLLDAKRKPMTKAVWGGSTIKVAFFVFQYKNDSAKDIGISLKMQAVQVIELVSSGGAGAAAGYFEDEEGYEVDDATDANGFEDEEGYESDEDDTDDDDGSGDF